jgi:hypothetical protein
MVLDALRGYMQLASGLTDVTRQRALAAAKQLLDQGGDVVDHAMASATSQAAPSAAAVRRQASVLAEELIATSRINRDLLVGLIRTEVERAVERLGLLSDRDEVATLSRVVERLQTQLDAAIAFGATTARQASSRRPGKKAGSKAGGSGGKRSPTPAAAAKKAAAKQAGAKKSGAKKSGAGKAPTKQSATKKSTAKKASAKKSGAEQAPRKTTPATAAAPVPSESSGSRTPGTGVEQTPGISSGSSAGQAGPPGASSTSAGASSGGTSNGGASSGSGEPA